MVTVLFEAEVLELRVWFFLDVTRCMGAWKDTHRMIHFLASPSGQAHSFFGLLRSKVKYRT